MSTKARKALGALTTNEDITPVGTPVGKKSQYQKLTQLEHVLVRPDTYVGSIEKIQDTMVVYDEGVGFVTREVSYVPGLFKIFDEILVNAADNKQRSPSMDALKVNIDREKNTISVYNTGRGIPVELHSTEKIYVPELIFGHLLTSSNYDDKKKKTTGGRNGYGAKLANIFSDSFTVETADSRTKKKYKQTFSKNMSKGHGKYTIKEGNKEDWTKITFTPDLARFGMTELDDDIVALMTRRVYDLAGIVRGVKVTLNNKRIPVNSFHDYVKLVIENSEGDFPLVHQVINDRWEVCVTVSTSGFQQVSFVNSIATTKGGTHVNYISDQVVKHLAPLISKKNKATSVKNHQIKSHLWVFVNCLIENPTFDSQTKENHTLAASKFGSKAELDAKFMKSVAKTGIIDNILVWAKVKGQELMSKKSGGQKRSRLTGIPKLDDANEAGGRNSKKCTLILTEGDSAKTLALSGLSIIGRDHYGVFPLKGKPLNVRDASQKQVLENQEIKSIVEIMGLQYGKVYDESMISKLRYGAIMIMADQDQDGSHIKGLIINFLHHFWPSLLKMENFLVEFITPIVKASKKKKEIQFYTLPEYESWSKEHENEKGWKIKYYKGLGTSTPQEAKSYFASMDNHQLSFVYEGPDDDTAIEMAFSKKRVEDRKNWLRGFKPGTFLDHSVKQIVYSDFIHQELILFSMADNVRSIPSVVDGFKPGQRKILFSCFKRKLVNEIKVAQLAGYVAEHSAYHHGEASLTGTIVNMAQTYVGSNNIALLAPCGQFGTRIQGGKDSASARYIFTKLQAITRFIFHPHDDALLSYLEDDGQSIEPSWYLPILPMTLVNGSDGIGTGWSTKVPTFDPRNLCEYLKAKMEDRETPDVLPHFNGFTGTIAIDTKKADRYIITGRIEKTSDTTLEVTELPVKEWTQDYKVFLDGLLTGDEAPAAFQKKTTKTTQKEPSIKDFKEYHTDTSVHFTITLTEEQMAAAEAIGLDKKFKMETSIATSNMVLFDANGRLKKYDTINSIIDDFYDLRLTYYQKRKDNLSDKLTEEWTRLDNRVRFIMEIINGTLELRNRPKKELLVDMKARGYTAFPKKAVQQNEGDDEDDGNQGGGANDGYDYLLGMPFWSLTMEKVNKLKEERSGKEEELNELLAKSPKGIWMIDIDQFLVQLDILDAEMNDDKVAANKMRAAASKGSKKPKGKKATKNTSDDEEEWAPSKPKKAASRAKKAPVKKVEEIEEIEEIEEVVEEVKKPAAKRQVRARDPVKPLISSPSEASPAPKLARRMAAKKTSAPVFNLDDSSDEDELTVGLAARLAAGKKKSALAAAKSQPKAKAAPKKKATVVKKKAAAFQSDDDGDDDDFTISANEEEEEDKENAPAKSRSKRPTATKSKYVFSDGSDAASDEDDYIVEKPKAAAKKNPMSRAKAAAKKPAAKKAVVDSDMSDVDDKDADDVEMLAISDDEPAPNPVKAKAKPAAKKAAPKSKAKAKAPVKKTVASKAKTVKAKKVPTKRVVESEDEAEEFTETITPQKSAARPSRRKAAATVTYCFSDDEEPEDEGSDFDDDGDDSDFEM